MPITETESDHSLPVYKVNEKKKHVRKSVSGCQKKGVIKRKHPSAKACFIVLFVLFL